MASFLGHMAFGLASQPLTLPLASAASDAQRYFRVEALPQSIKRQTSPPWLSLCPGTLARLDTKQGHTDFVCMCSPESSRQSGQGPDLPEVNPLGEEGWADLEAGADKVLNSEESKELLKDLEAAAKRVSDARAALDEIARKERELMEARFRLEAMAAHEADVASADALTRDSEREVAEAEEELRAASVALVKARAGISGQSQAFDRKWESEDIDEAAERIESGKAAAIAGLAGAFASLPFVLAASEAPLSVGTLISEGAVVATCLLFGVTYRYIIRRDVGNTQLKGGAVGAFSLARGLAQVDTTQSLVGFPDSGFSEVLRAALNAGESVIVLAFAAIALEYCLREGILSPFPTRMQK